MAGSSVIPVELRGSYFPEYYVYDGGPGDEDGRRDGTLTYTTYFGNGPIQIPGLSNYVKDVLGLPFPLTESTKNNLLYSFEDYNNQGKDTYSPVYLYTYGHRDESGEIHADSPGAHLALNPGESLKLITRFPNGSATIGKYPAASTAGVAFIDSGGTGSTNTHFHGLNVSPKGYGDNVDIESRSDFENIIKIPKSHHEGLSWWHPHLHGSANAQVYGGAFGNLQIGDSLSHVKGFENSRRSFIGIKNFNVSFNQQTLRFEAQTSSFTPEDTARNIYLVNGEYKPVKGGYSTGEWNSFAFINYASNSFLNTKIVKTLDGVAFDIKDKSTWGESVDLYIYGKDGYQTPNIEKAYTGINNTILNGLQLEDPIGDVVTELPSPDLNNNLFLSPARRYETLAYFKDPGDYKVISEAWTGAGLRAGGWIWPDIELATIQVDGPSVGEPTILPSDVSPDQPYPSINLNLANYEPLKVRRITWSSDSFVEGPNRFKKINGGIYNTNEILGNGQPNRYAGYNPPFLINDNVLPYNPALITQLDSLEYWDQENWSTEQHPFHPHQNHFQIVPTQQPAQSRVGAGPTIQNTNSVRETIILFVTYLGRVPTAEELRQYSAELDQSLTRDGLAKILSSSDRYRAEFRRYYVTEHDQTRDPYSQVADGAYYTITRENIYNQALANKYAKLLKTVGYEKFPLALLDRITSSSAGSATRDRLNNLATAALYAINKISEAQPYESVQTALLRVINQQITENPVSVTRLYPIIDALMDYDPNNVINGEAYEGESPIRMDNVALPAALIQDQSFSLPSTNRYPTPAIYNRLSPGRLTTATTYDNYTGGFLQHCHILPHEDSGQGVIVKIIDNMQRSWLTPKKEFADGAAIRVFRSADGNEQIIPSNNAGERRIATGDTNKDGYSDIVVVNGDGGSDLVSVVDGRTLETKYQFNALSDYQLGQAATTTGASTWNHGLFVEVADLTGDGLSDIVLGAGEGGGNRLRVFTRTNDGFKFSGETYAFTSEAAYADLNSTQFKLGDFDADNFTDIAFLGNESDGSPIEVRSSRDGTVLSLFKAGLNGSLGLSSGFANHHNLGLETLYIYEKDTAEGLVKAATLRAAMYVAHSRIADNPYYDAAKYYGYADSDEQTLLSKPIGKIKAEQGFDWLLADQFSLAESLPARDPITGSEYKLDASFSGYLANPVLMASSGDHSEFLNYTSQGKRDRLPFWSSNPQYRAIARDVIGLFATNLGRLPSPAELHRLTDRIYSDGKSLSYVNEVITYSGQYNIRNEVSVDALSDRFYDHASGEIRYAYQGITNLKNRNSFSMIADEASGLKSYTQATLENIKDFGLYLDSQIVNNMNIDGDIFMYLGASEKIRGLLYNSFASIGDSVSSVNLAKQALNNSLAGNYQYPNGETSPITNGLYVGGSSYVESITLLHDNLLANANPSIVNTGIGGSHNHHMHA